MDSAHRSLSILHLCTTDTRGGAARAAYRLHHGLRACGHRSDFLVKKKFGNDSTVRQFRADNSLLRRLRRSLRGYVLAQAQHRIKPLLKDHYEPFTDDRSRFGADIAAVLAPDTDVVNLHWVADDFLDWGGFFDSGRVRKPVVWTLHDANPFTGGCHCTGECTRYENACGCCPKLQSHVERDFSRQIWQRKKASLAALRPEQLHIVCPSKWMQQKASASSLFGDFPVHHIPNGIDTKVFAPCDTGDLAACLTGKHKTILFAAQSTRWEIKGFAPLLSALARLWDKRTDFSLLALGEPAEHPHVPFPITYTGKISNDQLLAAIYNAATVFAIPSLEDNLPNTVLEAMACGTPVAGFETGGIPDMVRPNETGLLAARGDVAALAGAIDTLLDNTEKRVAMGRRCREIAVAEYSLEVQANAYVDLYEGICS
jgi:glycosyltransferase involved in cell wall biosynthesis